MEHPPTPGISALGETGRVPIPAPDVVVPIPQGTRRPQAEREDAEPSEPVRAKPAVKPQPRPVQPARQRGDDVIRDRSKGKVVTGALPAGVNPRRREVLELPMPATKRPRRSMASFTSVDGETYSFRTHDTRGKPVPYRESMGLTLALIELAKGGNPLVVLEAFKWGVTDVDGKVIFPIPEDVLERLGGLRDFRGVEPEEPEFVEPEEEEDAGSYQLGS